VVFEELLQDWDGEEAVIRYDRDSGAWMFVCIHSTVLGPAGGGTRLRVYARPGDGLADAMRLSRRSSPVGLSGTDRSHSQIRGPAGSAGVRSAKPKPERLKCAALQPSVVMNRR